MGESKMTTALKTGMNSRNLKKHLKYIVPEMRLALIKEPGVKPQAVLGPDDLERFVEPLKHYADYVSELIMCRCCEST